MKQRLGDLITEAKAGEFDVIAHGCNCFRTMGAGIALAVKNVFPEAWEADLAGDKRIPHTLGQFTYAETDSCIVVNAYTQYQPGRPSEDDSAISRYRAIHTAMKRITSEFKGKRIGIPLIGCGLAGLDWNVVEDILIKLDAQHLEVVHFIGDSYLDGLVDGREVMAMNSSNHRFFADNGDIVL